MKKRFFLVLTSFLLVAIATCTVGVYAWFSVYDKAGTMDFQMARVNSEVYFYTARDANLNGIPDLISETDKPAAVEEEKHDIYYAENKYFNFREKLEAKAKTAAGVDIDKISIADFMLGVFPSQIFTVKLSLVNKGDTKNTVKINVNAQSFSEANPAKIYSAFAVRTVKIARAEDGAGGEASGEVGAPIYEVGEWIYLCQKASSATDFEEFCAETDEIKGLDAVMENENGKALNVCDYWLQFKLLPFEEYSEKLGEVSLAAEYFGVGSESEYQKLQTASFSFDISVLFEVEIADESL